MEQQSLALMIRIVEMVTQVRDVIVDPFCGTGTTLIAALHTNRQWLASDLSLSACNQTIERLREHSKQEWHLLTEETARSLPVCNTVTEMIRRLPPLADGISVDILEVINSSESKTLEFKQSLSWDVKTNDKQKWIETAVLKTIAAFLNSDGGTLLIGVTDARVAAGVDDEIKRFYDGSEDKFLLHFKNLIRTHIGEEFYPLLDYNLVLADAKQILRVVCKRSDRPCFVGDDFYVRTNPATDKLTGLTMVKYVSTRFPNFST